MSVAPKTVELSSQASKAVNIQDFPIDKLDQIKSAARENGVRDSDASAIRWAAIQWANYIESQNAIAK